MSIPSDINIAFNNLAEQYPENLGSILQTQFAVFEALGFEEHCETIIEVMLNNDLGEFINENMKLYAPTKFNPVSFCDFCERLWNA